MKNHPVYTNGKEEWISRSVATCVNVYARVNGNVCILANKRGPGLPNKAGKWNCISGFLDYNETLLECAVREVWEETGVTINQEDLQLFRIDDSPTREHQVILFRYFMWLDNPNDFELTNANSEPNEVDEIKWVPLYELDKYDWTSENHKNIILEIYDKNYKYERGY